MNKKKTNIINSISNTPKELKSANLSNNLFNSVETQLNEGLPQVSDVNPPHNITRTEHSKCHFDVTESELIKYMNQLEPLGTNSKSSIKPNLFKLAVPYLLKYLCELMKKAFSAGILHDSLKKVTEIPIF